MEIKVSVTLPTEISQLLIKGLTKWAGDADVTATPEEEPAKPATKSAPKSAPKSAVGATKPATTSKKAPAKPEPVPEPAEEPIEEDLQSPADEPTEDDFADPEEETEADTDELLTADEVKQLKAALRAHSEKHGSREAAVKILMKYAKASTEVKRKDLPELLKKLKV